jgi:hypothetical protein
MTAVSEMSLSRKTKDAAGSALQREASYDEILSAIMFADLPPGSSVDEKSLSRDMNLGLGIGSRWASTVDAQGAFGAACADWHARAGSDAS